MADDLIEITAFVRRELERTIAIWDGAVDDDGAEIWTWLPKSQVEYNGITVLMPEWLARDRELVARIDKAESDTAKLKARIARLEARLVELERRLGTEPTKH